MEARRHVALKESIRSIPDYPKPGIVFRDITTLLSDQRSFRRAVDSLVHPFAGGRIDQVAGIEARGFILGGAVAHQLSAGFVPVRKKGKLPHATVRIAYSLEYGVDEMEMHQDSIRKGERVILIDDLIATGGTAEGAVKLLRQLGATVEAAVRGLAQFDLDFLTVHGDPHVVRAAKEGAAGSSLKILGVTILTSLERADLDAGMIQPGDLHEITVERAARAFEAGADGIICSPREAAAIRALPGAGGRPSSPATMPPAGSS